MESTLQAVTDFLKDVGCCHTGNNTGSLLKEREENDEDGEINRRNGGFVPYAGGKVRLLKVANHIWGERDSNGAGCCFCFYCISFAYFLNSPFLLLSGCCCCYRL